MAASSPASSPKPRLGRGLSSLIVNSSPPTHSDLTYVPVRGTSPPAATSAQSAVPQAPLEIPLDRIAPNPYQPRREFPADELTELAQSIAIQGVLQPLIVATSTAAAPEISYVLIAGERRLRAARQAGLSAVPCVVRTASPQQMLEWALVENIQRTDLGPVERARAYQEYIARFDLTQAQAAERLSEPRATVANYLRILELHQDVQQLLTDGFLTFGHAKVLGSLVAQPDRQVEIAKRLVAEGLSVRQTEEIIRSFQKPSDPHATAVSAKSLPPRPPYLADLEERLTGAIGTRVRILPARAKHTGRIVVEYYTLDDFDRIASALGLPSSE